MSGFTDPFLLNPPSTPDERPNRPRNPFTSFGSHPSTTPAGPPPSSAPSFTPAGPPPSTVFASSQVDTGNYSFFSRQPDFGYSRPTPHNYQNSPGKYTSRFTSFGGGNYGAPMSSPLREEVSDEEDDEEESEEGHSDDNPSHDEEYYDDDYTDPDMDVDTERGSMRTDDVTDMSQQTHDTIPGTRWNKSTKPGSLHSLDLGTPRGTKRPKLGRTSKKDSAFPSIAKDLATRSRAAPVNEPDTILLATEELVEYMYDQVAELEKGELPPIYSKVTEELTKVWASNMKNYDIVNGIDQHPSIGPGENEPPVAKAGFLATLLLRLHHPPLAKEKQATALSRSGERPSSQSRTVPMPKVLLDWLNTNHNPYLSTLSGLAIYQPDATAHDSFWDIILTSVLRGKLHDVVRILKDADFSYAKSALDDGQGGIGYHGIQLGNIQRVINRAIQVLESCPAMQNGDWDLKGEDWVLFRHKVERNIVELTTFAEDRDRDLDRSTNDSFKAEKFGLNNKTSPHGSLTQATRKATSRVPWTIYQNLKVFYGLLLGRSTEIISFAQDWVEASIGLTAWWDGDDDDEIVLKASANLRKSFHASQSRIPRSVDENPTAAYIRRLSYAFDRVTDDSDEEAFQINSLNPVEVGLACIFEGNVEGVIGLLRTWSLAIASTTVEIADLAGWLDLSAGGPTKVIPGFNESDLMVLSYGGAQNNTQLNRLVTKDGLLIEYAAGLAKHKIIRIEHLGVEREGWQLSMEVLSRLDNAKTLESKISDLLDDISLDSYKRVDKVLKLTRDIGLENLGYKTAEKYADSLTTTTSTPSYGTTLLLYARAHSSRKLRNVLSLLTSFCIVSSSVYPSPADLSNDPTLSSLLHDPQSILGSLANKDAQAVQLVQFYFGGYATVRRFYELRDNLDSQTASSSNPKKLSPLSRKRLAGQLLMSCIASAADSIHGGLYDPDRESVIQVDVLLALLAESLMFLNQSPPLLPLSSLHQLLKAVEDFTASPDRIVIQNNEVIKSCIKSYRSPNDSPSSSARSMLKKSISDLTSTGSFSLIGSEMLSNNGSEDVDTHSNGKIEESMEGSGVLLSKKPAKGDKAHGTGNSVERAWDWRKGWSRRAIKGEEVISVLRLGLAREMANRWILGEDQGEFGTF
ncbi:MAG: hypothetical protein M1834_002496 [Cirrosporium novae-zelandiae]|nr:MAG: hypothetical protein M1834_002496 [Cirrosporium novae-zelandiae]